jgi:hypothetical protein
MTPGSRRAIIGGVQLGSGRSGASAAQLDADALRDEIRRAGWSLEQLEEQ